LTDKEVDSLVSSHVYEIMKTIYNTPAADSSDATRISVLQNTLSQLRLTNIATLDALMTHFTRLAELTSADEAYVAALATTLAPCILRPKTETSMTMEEKFSYRLVRDLFAHKEAIFSELKRASSLTHSGSVTAPRPRAISSDESNRKANMEARSRAIIAAGAPRSRAASPQPSPAGRGHRRDRSSGGPETRFPIASPPMQDHTRQARAATTSAITHTTLEVPDTPTMNTVELSNGATASPPKSTSNGSGERSITSATYIPGMDDEISHHPVPEDVGVEKKNSLGRSGAAPTSRFAGRKPVGMSRKSQDATKRDSAGSFHGSDDSTRVGVSLTDKPMID
jgi:hypothetical protein